MCTTIHDKIYMYIPTRKYRNLFFKYIILMIVTLLRCLSKVGCTITRDDLNKNNTT